MANDLRHPEKVDLSWIEKPDPPLPSVVTVKKTSWLFLIGLIVIVLIVVIVILLRK